MLVRGVTLWTGAFLATALVACGSSYDHAGLTVHTIGGAPLPTPPFGNATVSPPVAVVPSSPRPGAKPAPSSKPASVPPGAPAPGPSPSPGPAPTPAPSPAPIPAGLAASTGPLVGTNALTVTFGTAPSFAAVEVRRLAGSTAPDCTTGTIVKDYVGPFSEASATFNDQTGTALQTYSYRACFLDASGTPTAGTDAPTATTKPHILFVSEPSLAGGLGGSAKAADALCAPFAAASTLQALQQDTTWQAVISDSTQNASVRIQILGNVAAADYNPTAAYHTLASTPTQLWTSGLMAGNGSVLDATANPVQSLAWTGSDASGNDLAGADCSSWSSSSSSVDGQTGDASTLTGSSWLSSGGPNACNQLRAIYCISEPTPMLSGVTGMTQPNSIDLTITPPAQSMTNATIIVRRRAFVAGLPSATCNSVLDTPVLTVPFGSNVVTFTDNQASSNTAYNYRACLLDANGNLVFSTVALGITTSL